MLKSPKDQFSKTFPLFFLLFPHPHPHSFPFYPPPPPPACFPFSGAHRPPPTASTTEGRAPFSRDPRPRLPTSPSPGRDFSLLGPVSKLPPYSSGRVSETKARSLSVFLLHLLTLRHLPAPGAAACVRALPPPGRTGGQARGETALHPDASPLRCLLAALWMLHPHRTRQQAAQERPRPTKRPLGGIVGRDWKRGGFCGPRPTGPSLPLAAHRGREPAAASSPLSTAHSFSCF